MRRSACYLWSVLALAMTFTMVSGSLAFARSTTNVPLSDPTYRFIDKLVGDGLVKDSIIGQRPFSRSEIARLIIQARRKFEERGSSHDRFIEQTLVKLEKRFGEDIATLYGESGAQPFFQLHSLEELDVDFTWTNSESRDIPANNMGTIDARMYPFFDSHEGRHAVPGSNFSLEGESRGNISRFFSFDIHPRFQILNGSQGEEHADLLLHTGYGKLSAWNVELEIGRDTVVWGQGPHGGLLLSDNARPLDMIKLSSDHPFRLPSFLQYLGDMKLSVFVGTLGPEWVFAYPFFTGAKLSLKPFSFLELGASQALIMGGEGAPSLSFWDGVGEFFAYRPGIGFTPNDIGTTDPNLSNRIMGIDVRILLPFLRGTQVYAEMFTEACCGIFDQLYAYYGGLYLPRLSPSGTIDFRVEYRHIPPVFYRHGTHTDGWMLNRRILGDPLGPHGDSILWESYYDFSDHNSLQASFVFEHRDSDLFANNGTIETTYVLEGRPAEDRYRAEFRYHHQTQKFMEFSTSVGYERVQQFNFIPGDNRNNVLIGMSVAFDLDRFFQFSH